MINIKVTAKVDKNNINGADINISNETDGTLIEIMHESLAVVRSVSGCLRKHDKWGHMMFLKALADDHSILLGEEEEPDEDEQKEESVLAKMMSKAIIG